MNMLECRNISKSFPIKRGYLQEEAGSLKALDGVSLSIGKGEVFGLVGESGCGKTTLGKVVLGILPPDGGTVELAAKRTQVVFQDPFNSLDPRMRVSDILAEGLALQGASGGAIRKKLDDITDLIRLPKSALTKYPHQFSGGERQRIAIGRAVLTDPEFIVCDEPVSSLDVTIQLQILRLLKDVRERFGMTYLFISHDLRVIRFMCDRVAVMRGGRIVEEGPAARVYSNPSDPYTRQLLSSILEVRPKT
jgi:ABC-type glutathione transport system ATPase component